MMAEVKIQKATINNLKDIQELNLALFKKEYGEFDNTLNCNWPFSKKGEEYFKNKITERGSCAFVAIKGNIIVGYLVGGLQRGEAYRTVLNFAELENMFVLEKYRGLGIGTKLTQAFIKWCKFKKVKRIKVTVTTQNTEAINFYKRNNFSEYSITLEEEN